MKEKKKKLKRWEPRPEPRGKQRTIGKDVYALMELVFQGARKDITVAGRQGIPRLNIKFEDAASTERSTTIDQITTREGLITLGRDINIYDGRSVLASIPDFVRTIMYPFGKPFASPLSGYRLETMPSKRGRHMKSPMFFETIIDDGVSIIPDQAGLHMIEGLPQEFEDILTKDGARVYDISEGKDTDPIHVGIRTKNRSFWGPQLIEMDTIEDDELAENMFYLENEKFRYLAPLEKITGGNKVLSKLLWPIKWLPVPVPSGFYGGLKMTVGGEEIPREKKSRKGKRWEDEHTIMRVKNNYFSHLGGLGFGIGRYDHTIDFYDEDLTVHVKPHYIFLKSWKIPLLNIPYTVAAIKQYFHGEEWGFTDVRHKKNFFSNLTGVKMVDDDDRGIELYIVDDPAHSDRKVGVRKCSKEPVHLYFDFGDLPDDKALQKDLSMDIRHVHPSLFKIYDKMKYEVNHEIDFNWHSPSSWMTSFCEKMPDFVYNRLPEDKKNKVDEVIAKSKSDAQNKDQIDVFGLVDEFNWYRPSCWMTSFCEKMPDFVYNRLPEDKKNKVDDVIARGNERYVPVGKYVIGDASHKTPPKCYFKPRKKISSVIPEGVANHLPPWLVPNTVELGEVCLEDDSKNVYSDKDEIGYFIIKSEVPIDNVKEFKEEKWVKNKNTGDYVKVQVPVKLYDPDETIYKHSLAAFLRDKYKQNSKGLMIIDMALALLATQQEGLRFGSYNEDFASAMDAATIAHAPGADNLLKITINLNTLPKSLAYIVKDVYGVDPPQWFMEHLDRVYGMKAA